MRFVPILIQFLFALILIQKGFAQGEPPTRMKGESESGYGVSNNIVVPYNQSTKLSGVTRKIETGSLNVLKNPSFSATPGSEWTFTSGSGSIVSTSIDGKGLEVTNSGSGGKVCQQVTIPTNQWQNLNFTASAFVKTSASDVSVCSMVDGVEQSCVPVANTNTYSNYSVPSVAGATSVGICIKATSGSSVYYIDDAYVGAEDSVISGVSQAGFFGQLRYAGTTNCDWNAAATGSAQVFSADSDCPTPSVTGYIKAPSTKIPAVVIPAGSPSGKYTFNFIGGFYNANTSASSSSITWFLYNGTGYYSMGQNGASTASTVISAYTPNLSATVEYTTSTTDTTFQLAGNYPSGGGRNFGVYAGATTYDLYVNVFFSPSNSPAMYADRCKNIFDCEYEFSAYISSAGAVSGENLDWINGSVTVSDTSQYAITLNTSLGLANGLNCVVSTNGNNDTDLLAKLKSSTNTTITYRTLTGATKVASDVYIKCSKVGSDYEKAKVNKIIGTFKDVITAQGTPNGQPKACSFSVHGATENSACTSSPCVVTRQVGCSVGVTRSGTGGYSATITNTPFTQLPACVTSNDVTSTSRDTCNGQFTTTSSGSFGCRRQTTDATADINFSVTCVGY